MPTASPYVTGVSLPTNVDVTFGDAYAVFSVTTQDSQIETLVIVLDHPVEVDEPYYPAPGFGSLATGGLHNTDTITVFNPYISMRPTNDVYSQTTNPDGSTTYSVQVPLAAGTHDTYSINEIDIYDGSSRTISGSDLTVDGFPTTFSVTSDHVAPVLTALAMPTGAVVASQNGISSFSVAAADSASGIRTVVVHFASVEGASANPGDFTFSSLSRLDDRSFGTTELTDGHGTATFSTANLHGTYAVSSVEVTDAAGNLTTYTNGQLQALGVSTQFTVGLAKTADFNGDARSDLLWLHQSGGVQTWSASGSGNHDDFISNTFAAQVGKGWQVADTLDFNGDGNADILWRHSNGAMSIWTGSNNGFGIVYNDSTLSASWKIAGTGDLNGDGYGDLVLRNNEGTVTTWLSQGHNSFSKDVFTIGSPGSDWHIEGLGDFDGDGKADLLWRNDNGSIATWSSTGYGLQAAYGSEIIDRSWHIEGIGDFNGDGKSDLLWVNDNGSVSAWMGQAGGFQENTFNTTVPGGWTVAEVGDFNNDRLDDLMWRYADGTISAWNSTGSNWAQNTYSLSGIGNDWTLTGHHFEL